MHETSREYWRHPRRYATSDEMHISEPKYYAQEGLGALSEWLIEVLRDARLSRSHRILEVGCNCGRNLDHLFKAGFTNVFGVELNPEAADHAWTAYPRIADKIVCSDAQSYLAEQASNSFNVVFTQGVLMHIQPDEDYLFGQMARVARHLILVNEVEIAAGILERHKFARNYKEVFEAFDGWVQVFEGSYSNAITRIFQKERIMHMESDLSWEE